MRRRDRLAAEAPERSPAQIASERVVVPFSRCARAKAAAYTSARFLSDRPWLMLWTVPMARQTAAVCNGCSERWSGAGSDHGAATHAEVTGHEVIADDRVVYVIDSRASAAAAGA